MGSNNEEWVTKIRNGWQFLYGIDPLRTHNRSVEYEKWPTLCIVYGEKACFMKGMYIT